MADIKTEPPLTATNVSITPKTTNENTTEPFTSAFNTTTVTSTLPSTSVNETTSVNVTEATTLTSNSTPAPTTSTIAVTSTTSAGTTTPTSVPNVTTVTDNATTVLVEQSKDEGGMSTGGMVGIVAGSCVIVMFFLILLYIIYRRRKKTPRPVYIPKLPSAADVDKAIGQLNVRPTNQAQVLANQTQDLQLEGCNNQDELYTNLDKDGNPTDGTNPHVGDDGYLKKTKTGVDYQNAGKKKGRKKKIKNKFNKGKKTKHQPDDINLREHVTTSSPEGIHLYVNRAVSDTGYSEGRAAEDPKQGYSHGRAADDPEQGYSQGRAAETPETKYDCVKDMNRAKKKNKKKDRLYENTKSSNNRYENLRGVQHGAYGGAEEDYYNTKEGNGRPTSIYENT